MIVKTFSGPSLRDALATVREAFGDDAVILDTRFESPSGGRLGSRERNVHITAAFEPNPTNQQPVEGPRTLTLKGDLGLEEMPPPPTPVAQAAVVPIVDAEPDVIEVDETEAKDGETDIAGTDDAEIEESVAEPVPTGSQGDLIARLARLAVVRPQSDQMGLTSWLATQPKLAHEVIDAYAAHIAESLPPFGPFLNRERSPLRVMFVGSRGTGRSNAMLKACVTRWRERQSQPNMLVISNSAHPTHEHLQSVCRSCGLGLHVESTTKGKFSLSRDLKRTDLFAEFVPDHTDGDVTNHARAIRKIVGPDVVAVVLNATNAAAHWQKVLDRFAAFAPTHIVMTHWDECQPWAEIAELSRNHNLSLAYRISGSDLFDEIDSFTESDIRVGVSDHLARGFARIRTGTDGGGR